MYVQNHLGIALWYVWVGEHCDILMGRGGGGSFWYIKIVLIFHKFCRIYFEINKLGHLMNFVEK